MRIRSDIIRVVVADELGMKHRLVNEPGDEGEPETNEHRLPQSFHVEFPEGSVFPHVRVDPNEVYFPCRGFPVSCVLATKAKARYRGNRISCKATAGDTPIRL